MTYTERKHKWQFEYLALRNKVVKSIFHHEHTAIVIFGPSKLRKSDILDFETMMYTSYFLFKSSSCYMPYDHVNDNRVAKIEMF